jgi:hypothetical protein
MKAPGWVSSVATTGWQGELSERAAPRTQTHFMPMARSRIPPGRPAHF